MKSKLYNVKLANVQRVLYATNKKEALGKFFDYTMQYIDTLSNVNELRFILKHALSKNYIVDEIKISLLETAYYKIKERVLWHNTPGYIHSYSKTFIGKRYGYQINYNIQLDNGTFIDNSRYDELLNESTLEPNIDGFVV